MDKLIYHTKVTKIALFFFIMGSLFYCYEFFIQMAPAAMIAPLMHAFSADATEIGFLSSCFFWSYTLSQIPAGLLLDKYGSRIVLTIVCFLCSIAIIVFSTTNNIIIAGAARIVMGICGAFGFVGVIYLVIRWFPKRNLAVFVGILQLLGCFGAIGAASMLSKILESHNWRTVLLILGYIGMAITVLTWLCVRNKPKQFQFESGQTTKMSAALMSVLTNRQTWTIGLYSFAIWAPLIAFAGLWGISFLETNYHLQPMLAANGVSLVWLGIGIGSPMIGVFSNWTNSRRPHLALFAILGIFSSLVVIYSNSTSIPVLYIALFMLGFAGGAQALAFGVVADNNPVEITGAANGFNNMAVVLGGIVVQPLVGLLLDSSWHGAMINHIRIYSASNYKYALVALPLLFGLAFLTSLFLVKESYSTEKTIPTK